MMAFCNRSSLLFSPALGFNFSEKGTPQKPTTQGFPGLHNQKPRMRVSASQFMARTPSSQSSFSPFAREICTQRKFTCRAFAQSDLEMRALQKIKLDLLRAAQDTQRGLQASDDQRAIIEETMVSVERYDAGIPIDLSQLDGTWLLQYTSASDVLVLLEAARLPLFEVTIGNFMISEELQALIAPAILPRTFLNLKILQFIRNFKAQVPLRRDGDQQINRRPSLGGVYYLSYLDHDMLLGRALGGGGAFIFSRTQPLQV